AQSANITITVHVTPTPKTYSVQVSPGTTVETTMQQAKMQYTATWFPSVGGYSPMILENTPSTTNGAFGSQYWWLCINEVSAQLGMSAQPDNDGDTIGWYYISDAKCPRDAAKPH